MSDLDAEISRLKRQVLTLEAQGARDEHELVRLRNALRGAEEELREWRKQQAEPDAPADLMRIEMARRRFGLTAGEAAIFLMLIDRAPNVCRRDDLLECRPLADRHREPSPKLLDVLISKLRSKLFREGYPNVIETAWSEGYFVGWNPSRRLRAELLQAIAA